MNASYSYKPYKNNAYYAPCASKKGSCRPFVRRHSVQMEISEKCLTIIDMILDFFCSAKFIVRAKAAFGFLSFVGLLGIIGGMEFGTVSLLSGMACLTLVVALEFLVLKDDEEYN